MRNSRAGLRGRRFSLREQAMDRERSPPSSAFRAWPLACLIALSGTTGADDAVHVVVARSVPVVYQAVGTVRPRVEANVMAQASGRLLSVSVGEGTTVTKGDELATVEDRELSLRLAQAKRSVEEAQARSMQARHGKVGALALLSQATAQHERVKKFVASNAATPQELEQTKAAFEQAQAAANGADEAIKAADAAVERARDGVREVEVALGYARVTAPFDGVVVSRQVDPGDLAWPGRPLFRLMDPKHMRLEANVREGLAGKIRPGQTLAVTVEAVGARVEGTVDQVVPSADPTSRTFVVKVSLPEDQRLLPGMFGRLDVPTATRQAIMIPAQAVRRLGQLATVRVVDKGKTRLRLVRLGEVTGDDVEALAGLRAGETILLGQ